MSGTPVEHPQQQQQEEEQEKEAVKDQENVEAVTPVEKNDIGKTPVTESTSSNPSSADSTTSFTPGHTNKSPEELAKQQEIDSRSIYVGNVDYNTTPDELEKFFHPFGIINRVTILFDRYTGAPKGYAYVEFEDKEAVGKAVNELAGLEFKGRVISVVAKRTNLPGFRRGRGGRGGGRGGGGRGFVQRGSGGPFRGRVGGVRRGVGPKDFQQESN